MACYFVLCSTQVLTSTYSRDNSNYGARQDYDSYTQHSVAPKYQRPSTAPNRLEVDPDLTDLQQLSFAVSQSSTPDRDTGANGRPFIKRKVLRCGKFTSGGFVKTIMITFVAL
jgi:hypothetical protein